MTVIARGIVWDVEEASSSKEMAYLMGRKTEMAVSHTSMYGGGTQGAMSNMPLRSPSPTEDTSLWDEQNINETVTLDFLKKNIGGGKEQVELRKLLDTTMSFGHGLTESTYSEWIVEHAKILFLILLELGIPDKIIQVVDGSWDDEDLPFSPETIEKLALGSSSLEKRFLKKQHMFMLRGVEAGDHIDFHEDEVVPIVSTTKRQGINLVMQSMEKVYFPRRRDCFFTRMKVPLGSGEDCVKNDIFFAEIATMRKISHPHIISLFASYTHHGHGFLLFSPVCEINLKQFMHNTPNSFKSLPKERRRRILFEWMHCLSDAIAYVYDKGVAHRDIRPKSILIDQTTNQIFLADIGNNRRLDPSNKPGMYDVESYEYAAPELWQRSMTSLETTAPANIAFGGRAYRKNSTENSNQIDSTNSSNNLNNSPTSISFQVSQWISLTNNPSKSDTFSLGCVFLDILSFLAKRRPSAFATHRSKKQRRPRQGAKPDESFHANLGQVESWMKELEKDVGEKKGDATFLGILNLARDMVNYIPDGRPEPRAIQKRLFEILKKEFEGQPENGSANDGNGENDENKIQGMGILHCQPSATVEKDSVDFDAGFGHLSLNFNEIGTMPHSRARAGSDLASFTSDETIPSFFSDINPNLNFYRTEMATHTPQPHYLYQNHQNQYHRDGYSYDNIHASPPPDSPTITTSPTPTTVITTNQPCTSSSCSSSISSSSIHTLPIIPSRRRTSITSHITTSTSSSGSSSSISGSRTSSSTSIVGGGGGRSKRSATLAMGNRKERVNENEKEKDKDGQKHTTREQGTRKFLGMMGFGGVLGGMKESSKE